jgi:SAM-dependent methyltransferase
MTAPPSATPNACVARTAAAARASRDQQGWPVEATALLVESGVERVGAGDSRLAESVYSPAEGGRFGHVQLDPSYQLMSCEWSRGLVRRLLAQVSPGGALRIPLRSLPGHRHAEDAAAGWVGAAFGAFADVACGPESIELRPRLGAAAPRAASTVEWCAEHWQAALEIAVQGRVDDEPGLDRGAEAVGQASNLGYYVGGLSYKSPIMAFIARSHGLPEGLRLVDMGAGYGLLAAELLLDPVLKSGHATATDISPVNERLAGLLAPGLAAAARSFRFRRTPAQEFTFEEQVDLVSYVGSLLYVPREHLRRCLDRAWEALRPGGILVIHENIRDPKYVRDFRFMFSVDEIDAELTRFGEVQRYLSTRPQSVRKEDAAAKTVFRVVQRPRS